MNKTFTNLEIYNIANGLIEADFKKVSLPIKVNFFLQKNINKIISLAQEIDEARTGIITRFGSPVEDNPTQYEIPNDKIEEANKEIEDLFALTQEIEVRMFKLEDFGDAELSYSQVESISFMIEEEE